jgi:hypothetical protein
LHQTAQSHKAPIRSGKRLKKSIVDNLQKYVLALDETPVEARCVFFAGQAMDAQGGAR